MSTAVELCELTYLNSYVVCQAGVRFLYTANQFTTPQFCGVVGKSYIAIFSRPSLGNGDLIEGGAWGGAWYITCIHGFI